MLKWVDMDRLSMYYIDGRYMGYRCMRHYSCYEVRSLEYRKEKGKMDKALLSGSMGMLLLKLLSEGDKYGYEMIEELRKQSKNVFELKAGTLYPLLHGMEEKGMLASYEREVLGKTRKYYSITKEGRRVLKQKTEEWQEYSEAVFRVLALEG
jgi:DNA-binding PadR family transcriptional regulator